MTSREEAAKQYLSWQIVDLVKRTPDTQQAQELVVGKIEEIFTIAEQAASEESGSTEE